MMGATLVCKTELTGIAKGRSRKNEECGSRARVQHCSLRVHRTRLSDTCRLGSQFATEGDFVHSPDCAGAHGDVCRERACRVLSGKAQSEDQAAQPQSASCSRRRCHGPLSGTYRRRDTLAGHSRGRRSEALARTHTPTGGSAPWTANSSGKAFTSFTRLVALPISALKPNQRPEAK